MEILKIEQEIGIGPIKLNMNRNEVYKILGEPSNPKESLEWVDDYLKK